MCVSVRLGWHDIHILFCYFSLYCSSTCPSRCTGPTGSGLSPTSHEPQAADAHFNSKSTLSNFFRLNLRDRSQNEFSSSSSRVGNNLILSSFQITSTLQVASNQALNDGEYCIVFRSLNLLLSPSHPPFSPSPASGTEFHNDPCSVPTLILV